MSQPVLLVAAILVLAVGTYAFRLAGSLLRCCGTGTRFPPRGERAAGFLCGAARRRVGHLRADREQGFADWARPAGVVVGGLLAWRRVSFVVVVLVAAARAAGMRLLGVP